MCESRKSVIKVLNFFSHNHVNIFHRQPYGLLLEANGTGPNSSNCFSQGEQVLYQYIYLTRRSVLLSTPHLSTPFPSSSHFLYHRLISLSTVDLSTSPPTPLSSELPTPAQHISCTVDPSTPHLPNLHLTCPIDSSTSRSAKQPS